MNPSIPDPNGGEVPAGPASTPREPLPWYQWHPLVWLSDRRVQKLSWACQGLLRTLQDICWVEGCIPASPDELAAKLGEDLFQIKELLPPIMFCFLVEDGQMMCPKIEDLRSEQDKMRLQKSLAGKRSWEKRKSEMNTRPPNPNTR